ncbi:MAG TPA: hypothetical protein VF403_09380 [Kofleriaceae bacterium]
MSIGGTAVSLGVMIAGMTGQTNDRETMVGLASSLVTPSLGEWYAGKYLTVGMGLRAAGALAMIGGIAYSYCNDSGSQCSETLGHGLLAVGLIAYGGGIIYDIVMAPSAVDAYNTSHRVRATIGPAVLTPPSGPVMGVGLGGSF